MRLSNPKYAAYADAQAYFGLVREALGEEVDGAHLKLNLVDNLISHKSQTGNVVIIEYDVHGEILATGITYENRFCSIVEIENRKIAHWRDYMDSLSAWNALTERAR